MTKKILVVDDDFGDIESIKKVLEKNYSVIGATNGAQALDFLKKDSVDLILIDIQMPTLSGYDLLRLLRQKYNGRIPIVYVTVVPKKEVDMDGADGVVQKPFTAATLIKGVKKHLK